MSKKVYVLGFLFSPCLEQVLLVKKSRHPKVANQANKLNGIGGEVYKGEGIIQAIECFSKVEAGVNGFEWVSLGTATFPEADIHAFYATADLDVLLSARGTEREPVAVFDVAQFLQTATPLDAVQDVTELIHKALDMGPSCVAVPADDSIVDTQLWAQLARSIEEK